MKTKIRQSIDRSALVVAIVLASVSQSASAREFHVAIQGDDRQQGTREQPLRTIQHAADLAQPGDVITVHAGEYRERVDPPRGGTADDRRIIYQAAAGEAVEIKGSEVVRNWEKVQDGVWKAVIPNARFGKFNPYGDLIRGDWFTPLGRQHHTGAVYLNGDWLIEAAKLEEVLVPARNPAAYGDTGLWFARVDGAETTIWARFGGADPNRELVEINTRQTVFYPAKTGINYLTVRGFSMSQAATPWAPPTAEQIGLIGTHWSKGWIIENNVVRYSVCSGISLGKYGDEWDNKSANSATGYVQTITRALENGWSRENIGHHIVRNNTISHCEQAGVVGSLGAIFSSVTDNTIHDINVRRLFTGCEQAGIKFHAAIDTEIARNHIYRANRGIWMDWMAQGTRIRGNLLHDNGPDEDMYFEVDHGPFLVDHNLFLSPASLQSRSQGGAFAHNLFAGKLQIIPFDARQTPFHKAHSTEVAGLHDNPCGDTRYYNNIFVRRPVLGQYDAARLPVAMDGNVFLLGATPWKGESDPLVMPEYDPQVRVLEKPDGFYLAARFDKDLSSGRTRKPVTTELLGHAVVPDLPFENPDGSPIRLDVDYAGNPRQEANPAPGPFAHPLQGEIKIPGNPQRR